MGNNIYLIQKPSGEDPVNADELKYYIQSDHLQPLYPAAMEDDTNSPEFEIGKLLARRQRLQPSQLQPRVPEYKIRWKGYGEEADSWEPVTALQGHGEQALADYWNLKNNRRRTHQMNRLERQMVEEGMRQIKGD